MNLKMFSKRLKAVMEVENISRKELARLVGLGVTEQQIYEYEIGKFPTGSGEETPPQEIVDRIALVLDVPVDWLGGDETPKEVKHIQTKCMLYKLMQVLEGLQTYVNEETEEMGIILENSISKIDLESFIKECLRLKKLERSSCYPTYAKKEMIATLLETYKDCL